MHPSIILFILGAGITIGIISYTYHQGKQSCVSYYEHLSVKNALANKEKEARNYQEQIEYNETLLGEANIQRQELETKNAELQVYIDQIKSDNVVCLDREFLRKLRELRGSGSKKENPKPTK